MCLVILICVLLVKKTALFVPVLRTVLTVMMDGMLLMKRVLIITVRLLSSGIRQLVLVLIALLDVINVIVVTHVRSVLLQLRCAQKVHIKTPHQRIPLLNVNLVELINAEPAPMTELILHVANASKATNLQKTNA